MTTNKTLYVISHTHWDREWYESFQNYRFRLVRLMDELLDTMEKDSDYKYFHLDGQTIMLEDYLEIHPENESRLRKLISDGRIIIGPWYVMPDEFLVSGESLIRNLQKGIGQCKQYNSQYMKNGYVTDVFGHNAQFPQILNGFGIHHATLFRGAGNYPKDLFAWEGSDGSKVHVFRLDTDRCYSNFYFSLRWPFEGKDLDKTDLLKRAAEMIERSRVTSTSDSYLMMDGVDHIDADPRVPEIIRLLNENIEGITVKHSTIAEYTASVENMLDCTDTLHGPLYRLGEKGLNNKVLKNVLSSMVHLKQANDRCETSITSWAEPLDLAAQIFAHTSKSDQHADISRAGFLKRAWTYILQNHPHDSICGCSITDVHEDNAYRFRQAQQIIDRITLNAMERISSNIDTSGADADLCFTVFNPSHQEIDGYVNISLDLSPDVFRNFRLYNCSGIEIPYQITDIEDFILKREAPLLKLIEFKPYETCNLTAKLQIPQNGHTVLFVRQLTEIGPYPGEYTARAEPDKTRYLGTMRTGRNVWDNGRIVMSVAANGTLDITNKETGKKYENILTFEDCADIGEGWNYAKPITDSEYISVCGDCDVAVQSDGPFAVVLKLSRRLSLPVDSNYKRRNVVRKNVEIVSTLKMLKDSNTLQICTTIDNETTNHRLRVLFPTGYKAENFYTLTPFDMQEWPVKKVDYATFNETETNCNPSQGVTFISDGTDSFELYSKGLYEVEVCESDRTVALTLFRAFSNEVGQTSADLGHMKGKLSFEYAASFDAERTPAQALRSGLQFKQGIRSLQTGKHAGDLPLQMSYFGIRCQTSVVSALYSDGNSENGEIKESRNILRMYNPSDERDTVRMTNAGSVGFAHLVDFNGELLNDGITVDKNDLLFEIGAHKIVTIAFSVKSGIQDGIVHYNRLLTDLPSTKV